MSGKVGEHRLRMLRLRQASRAQGSTWFPRALLLVTVLGALVTAPLASHWLSEYRGVVLKVEEGELWVQRRNAPPEWVRTASANPGDVIEKRRYAWRPVVVTPAPQDRTLLEYFVRFTAVYEGVVVDVRPAWQQGGPTTVYVQPEGAASFPVELWGEQFAAMQKGMRLRKLAGEWEPRVVQ